MKRLYLLRHAKSDWDADFDTDHDRPLNGRGRNAADTMGRVLARAGAVPDVAITSSAVRARTTLERAIAAGEWTTSVTVTDDLYATSPESAMRVAAGATDDADALMLVGHEPTWSTLAYRLTGASVIVKTATVIALDLRIHHWNQLPAPAAIAFVLQPRLFTDGAWDAVLQG